MMNESNNSVVELVKRLSNLNETELTLSLADYTLMIEEIWSHDIFLKEKYMSPTCVPRIYSLFGVNIRIANAND